MAQALVGRTAATPFRLQSYIAACVGSSRSFVSSSTWLSSQPWKVAIVGSGPSGCYTAKYLTASKKDTFDVDILERLPTAYGLVRNGVAPDHPEVKNVQNDFDAMIAEQTRDSKIRFFGNVQVGKDVSLNELRSIYDMVVLAYGCESDRTLTIPGADLHGVLTAREFVAWYNGHVDFEWVGPIVEKTLLKSDAGGGKGEYPTNIVVVGHGNVALDCARILAKSREELDKTDIATRAWKILTPSNGDQTKRIISVVGRRGHVQGAFTIKELRELTKLDDADFVVRQDELEMGKATDASREELKESRPRTRMDKLITEAAAKKTRGKDCQVHLRFLLNPVRFEASSEDPEELGGLVCERTKLAGEKGAQRAEGTGEEEFLPAHLVSAVFAAEVEHF